MTVDMSPHAVTLRLQLVSELRDLCLALAPRRLPAENNGDLANDVATLPAQVVQAWTPSR